MPHSARAIAICSTAGALITTYALCLLGAALLQGQPLAGLRALRGPLALFSLGLASRLDAAAPPADPAAAAAGPASGLAPGAPTPGLPAAGEGRGPAGGGAGEDERGLPAVLEHGWFNDPSCTSHDTPWKGARKKDVWRPNGTCLHTDDKESYRFVCNASLGLVLVEKTNRHCSKVNGQWPMAPEMWQRIKRGECIFYGTAENGHDVYSQLNTTLPASYGVGCAAFPPPPRPSVGDTAGVACPPGSAALGLDGGRRLELSLLLPSKFREAFASEKDQPYSFCMRSVSVTVEDQKNEPAKGLDRKTRDALGVPRGESAFSDVKLLLAVMTPTYACDVRNVHRATWMTHSRVCALRRHAEAGCSIMPLFVFANASRDAVEEADDVVFLPDVQPANRQNNGVGVWWNLGKNREMWREGQYKTPAWFRHALQYPWATHVAKMDLDTYPFVTAIYNDLLRLPPTRVFYGRQFDQWRGGMYGEFYLVTKDIAAMWVGMENLTRKTRFQQFERTPEDTTFATVIRMGIHTYWFNIKGCEPGRWIHLR